jgi:putative Ca2+/H+ antiporter (TMEM165/GDT1 family)
VIASVTLATLAVHLGSTGAGVWVSDLLPESLMLTVVGLSFFWFAAWSLRGDSRDGERSPAGATGLGALGLITSAIFLSELGDKTQLATVSIAGEQESFVAVWLGSTLGMVVADAVAIGVGSVAEDSHPAAEVGHCCRRRLHHLWGSCAGACVRADARLTEECVRIYRLLRALYSALMVGGRYWN